MCRSYAFQQPAGGQHGVIVVIVVVVVMAVAVMAVAVTVGTDGKGVWGPPLSSLFSKTLRYLPGSATTHVR